MGFYWGRHTTKGQLKLHKSLADTRQISFTRVATRPNANKSYKIPGRHQANVSSTSCY